MGGSDFHRGAPSTSRSNLGDGVAAVRDEAAGKPHDEAKAAAITRRGREVRRDERRAPTSSRYRRTPTRDRLANGWHNAGPRPHETFGKGEVNPYVLSYAGMGYARRQGRARELRAHRAVVHCQHGEALPRQAGEEGQDRGPLQRRRAVLHAGMWIYLAAFLFAALSWLRWPRAGAANGVGARRPRRGDRGRGDRDPDVARGAAAGRSASIPPPSSSAGARSPSASSSRPSSRMRSGLRGRRRASASRRLIIAPPPRSGQGVHARDDARRPRFKLLKLGTHVLVVVTTGYASTFLRRRPRAPLHRPRPPSPGSSTRTGCRRARPGWSTGSCASRRSSASWGRCWEGSGPTSRGGDSGGGTRRRTAPSSSSSGTRSSFMRAGAAMS